MKHLIFGGVLFVALLASTGCTSRSIREELPLKEITIGARAFVVEVAHTEAQKEKGLQGRTYLEEGMGMLFEFDTPDQYELWMKGTLMSLDALWIADGKVVDITANMLPQPGVPDDQLTRYKPNQAVTKIVELSAGTVEASGIVVGDSFIFGTP